MALSALSKVAAEGELGGASKMGCPSRCNDPPRHHTVWRWVFTPASVQTACRSEGLDTVNLDEALIRLRRLQNREQAGQQHRRPVVIAALSQRSRTRGCSPETGSDAREQLRITSPQQITVGALRAEQEITSGSGSVARAACATLCRNGSIRICIQRLSGRHLGDAGGGMQRVAANEGPVEGLRQGLTERRFAAVTPMTTIEPVWACPCLTTRQRSSVAAGSQDRRVPGPVRGHLLTRLRAAQQSYSCAPRDAALYNAPTKTRRARWGS